MGFRVKGKLLKFGDIKTRLYVDELAFLENILMEEVERRDYY